MLDLRHFCRELSVGQQNFCFAVFQNVNQRFHIQAYVQCIEHSARHRHTKVCFNHGRGIRQQSGHRTVATHAMLAQGCCQLLATVGCLRPCLTQVTVNDGGVFRIDFLCPQ